MSGLALPLILGLCLLWGRFRGVEVFSALTDGAKAGLRTLTGVFPALCALLPVVYMLRASGALEALIHALAPVLEALGIPPETAGLMLLRPMSGSGALALGGEIFAQYGPDSLIGRTAAVMLGSTETTFYVLAVYFGAAGIRRSGHALPAALCADLAAFLAAAFTARLFFG